MSSEILSELNVFIRKMLGHLIEIETKALEADDMETYRKCVCLRYTLMYSQPAESK